MLSDLWSHVQWMSMFRRGWGPWSLISYKWKQHKNVQYIVHLAVNSFILTHSHLDILSIDFPCLPSKECIHPQPLLLPLGLLFFYCNTSCWRQIKNMISMIVLSFKVFFFSGKLKALMFIFMDMKWIKDPNIKNLSPLASSKGPCCLSANLLTLSWAYQARGLLCACRSLIIQVSSIFRTTLLHWFSIRAGFYLTSDSIHSSEQQNVCTQLR